VVLSEMPSFESTALALALTVLVPCNVTKNCVDHLQEVGAWTTLFLHSTAHAEESLHLKNSTAEVLSNANTATPQTSYILLSSKRQIQAKLGSPAF
jgi:hypothetical protein